MIKFQTEIGSITISEACVEDASEVVKFMNWVTGEVNFHTYGVNEFFLRPSDELRMIKRFRSRENSIFLIAKFDNMIIGIATVSGGTPDRVKHRGTIGITIAKRYWRLGIGIKMMEELIAFAENGNILTKLELLVHENNLAGISMYRKLNFFEEGRIQRYFCINGEYNLGINMGLFIK